MRQPIHIPDHRLEATRQALSCAPFGSKNSIRSALADEFDCTTSTIIRKLREYEDRRPPGGLKGTSFTIDEDGLRINGSMRSRNFQAALGSLQAPLTERAVLARIELIGRATAAELADALEAEEAAVRRALHRLQNRNAVRHAGGKRCLIRYTISPSYATFS